MKEVPHWPIHILMRQFFRAQFSQSWLKYFMSWPPNLLNQFFLNGLKTEKCFSLSVLSLFENDWWVEISFGVFTLIWKYVRQFKNKIGKNYFYDYLSKENWKVFVFIVFKVWNNTRKFYCWVTKLWKLNWFLWFFVFRFCVHFWKNSFFKCIAKVAD